MVTGIDGLIKCSYTTWSIFLSYTVDEPLVRFPHRAICAGLVDPQPHKSWGTRQALLDLLIHPLSCSAFLYSLWMHCSTFAVYFYAMQESYSETYCKNCKIPLSQISISYKKNFRQPRREHKIVLLNIHVTWCHHVILSTKCFKMSNFAKNTKSSWVWLLIRVAPAHCSS